MADYRSQEAAEGDFRQMKDPKVVSFSPMFHWTDQKIRVHVFYCVLALMVARLMAREAERGRGCTMSVRELLDTLAGIQETVLLYQGERGRPRARRMITEMDATQRRLYDAVRPRRLRPAPAMTATCTSLAWAALEAALRARRPVHVSYHGRRRLLCPHALGWKDRPADAARLPDRRPDQHRRAARRPRQRWRCLFVDEVDQRAAADHAAPWATADNYNPAHPFPAIDEVSLAVSGPSSWPS